MSPIPSKKQALAYSAAHSPDATIRTGLISNPMAHTNWRSVGHAQLCRLLADPSLACETPNIASLGETLSGLIFDRHINVLIINGGDGTIHHTLNTLIRLLNQVSDTHGHPLPLPHILFVNGGGMNIVARSLQVEGHPTRTVRDFLYQSRARRFGDLPTTPLPLLSVRSGDDLRYGTVFGSELVTNALMMYERFGQGYLGLSQVLLGALTGYLFRTELWFRFGHLLDPPTTPATLDGRHYPEYAAAVATSIPLQIARGHIRAIPTHPGPNTMNALLILERDPAKLIAQIPALMRARHHPKLVRNAYSTDLDICGPYTLDGELFIDVPADTPVHVRPSPITVRGIRC